MGVGASVALSIVRGDELWGMIVCHHGTPRYVPHPQRVVLQSLGHLLALQITAKERQEEAFEIARLHDWTLQALGSDHTGGDLYSSLRALGVRLLKFMAATGAAIHIGGGVFVIGKTPSMDMVAALARAIAAEVGGGGPGKIFATNMMQERFGSLPGINESGACGVLALSVSQDPADFVMWFRPEVTSGVAWAGDPRQPVANHPDGFGVMPRASFEAWI
jgi:light-regulated signal transduction histidine kinase (bacteriophytochrome)